MNYKTIFARLGYPKHTDKVYECLVESKKSLSVTEIAKQCNVSRVVVYRCLEKLEADALVQAVEIGKRTYYELTTLHQLKKLVQIYEKETAATIGKTIKAREKDVPQSIKFLHGPAGIKAAFDDVVSHCKRGETFFRYTSEQDLAKVNSYLARDYRLRRDKKKLERQVISNPVSGSQKKPRLERFIKFIPAEADQFEQNIIQLVYGDRLSLIDLTNEEVVVIENKQLAEFQKVIFRLLYKRLDR